MKNTTQKKILALSLLGFFLIFLSLSLVSAYGWEDFREGIIDKFLIPEGYADQYVVAVLAAIIGVILIFVIIADILSLVSPLSDYINWMIAAGVMILLVAIGWARTAVAYVMGVVVGIMGGAGAFALIMTAVIFLVGVIFLFFGGQKLQKWITEIKGRRQILEETKKAYKSAAYIKGLKTEAEESR